MTREAPELSLKDYTQGDAASRAAFSDAFMDGLQQYGFIILKDHGISTELLARAYGLAQAVFALPEDAKKQYAAGLRGYTPFGVEHAKDSGHPDLKEFWQIGHNPSPEAPEPRLRREDLADVVLTDDGRGHGGADAADAHGHASS